MVIRGGVVVRADDIAEARPQRRGELGALVGREVGRDAKAGYPLADQCVPAGLCLDVGQGDCLQHPAGPVNDGEQVTEFLPGDRERAHDVRGCGKTAAGAPGLVARRPRAVWSLVSTEVYIYTCTATKGQIELGRWLYSNIYVHCTTFLSERLETLEEG